MESITENLNSSPARSCTTVCPENINKTMRTRILIKNRSTKKGSHERIYSDAATYTFKYVHVYNWIQEFRS